MKKIIILSTMLLILSGREGRSQEAFLSGNKKYALKKGLKNPEMTEKIWLHCSPKEITRFISRAGELKNLRYVCLTGGDENSRWKTLMDTLATLPMLYGLQFDELSMTSLPAEIKKITRLRSVSINNSPKTDYDSSVIVLAALPYLDVLELGLYGMEGVPNNLCRLAGLSQLIITHVPFPEEQVFETEERSMTVYYSQPVRSTELLIKYRSDKNTFNIRDIAGLDGKLNCTDFHTQLSLDYGSAVERKRNVPSVIARKSFTVKRKNVNPPIPGLDVKKTVYTLDTEKPEKIEFASGTTITIPYNAFVHEDGSTVTGDILFDYREFRDPVDFLVSGIPMSGDSSGILGYYESAGMFEMNASQEGSPVFLADDKKIKVDFVSSSDSPDYNFYAFNDSTGQWMDRGKEGQTQTPVIRKKSDLTAAIQSYINLRKLYEIRRPRYDSTNFDGRWQSLNYFHTQRYTQPKNKSPKMFAQYKKRLVFNRYTSSASRYIRLKTKKKNKHGSVVFSIENKYASHPELNYVSKTWQTTDPFPTTTDFRNKTGVKDYLNDIRIVKEGDEYTLTFKGLSGYYTIHAIPVKEMHGLDPKVRYDTYKDGGSRMYKRYQNVLSHRKKTFNTFLKEHKLTDNYIWPEKINGNVEVRAWQKSKPYMTAPEQAMNFVTWKTYAENTFKKAEIEEVSSASASGENIVRSFSLGKTGIYNVDILKTIPDKVDVLASYTNTRKEKLNPGMIYIIDKGSNSLIRFDGYLGYGPEKIAFNKQSNKVLIAFEENKIGIYYPADFKKNNFKDNQKFEFVVEEKNILFTSVEELRKAIGM